MIKSRDTFFLFLGFLLIYYGTRAQDCTLDVGGADIEMMVRVFQLSQEQKNVMENLKANWEITSRRMKEDIQKLFDEHPQSTAEELQDLAEKYRELKQKLVKVSWETDKKMLATFNERQYGRYMDLCHEAFRKPIRVTPIPMVDSLSTH